MTQQIPAGTWNIDPTHSTVSFTVRHLAISKVKGAFEQFEGVITTGETAEQSSVRASVEVASVNTNQAQRDEHLRSGEFFKAEEFPQLTFVSTAVRQDGDELEVTGDLTMRGVTKQVTFEVEPGGVIVDGYGQTKLGFEASAKVNRKEFGIEWNAPLEAGGLTLGDEVKIELDIQAVLAQ
ncbi:Protein YceI [Pseudoclavibacter triregionum]|nr:Protein YceI [Pseudoclavibacter triregionum]